MNQMIRRRSNVGQGWELQDEPDDFRLRYYKEFKSLVLDARARDHVDSIKQRMGLKRALSNNPSVGQIFDYLAGNTFRTLAANINDSFHVSNVAAPEVIEDELKLWFAQHIMYGLVEWGHDYCDKLLQRPLSSTWKKSFLCRQA